MRWLRRRDTGELERLRDELACQGDVIHDLHRRLAAEKQRYLEQAGDLKTCRAERRRVESQAVSAKMAAREIGERLKAAEQRNRRAQEILTDPNLDGSEKAALGLQMLDGTDG